VTGLEFPARIDEEDARYRKLIELQRAVIERAFARWRSALHARYPEVVLLVSHSNAPDFLDRHFSERLMRLADAVKTEFDKGASPRADSFLTNLGVRVPARDARLALGWTYSRDGADGRPPHVWIPRLETAEQALFATAAVVAHGGVANLDHREETIPDARLFAPAIDLAQRVGPALAGLRPLRWLAIHVPERALDRLAPDDERAWREVIGPMTGAFELGLRQRLPVGLVSDHQLAEGRLEGYAALFLPAPGDLGGRMAAGVRAFEAAGGRGIRPAPDWDWNEPGAHARTSDAFLEQLDATGAPPLQLEGGPADLHVVAYTNANRDTLVLALTHGFSWVRTSGARSGSGPSGSVQGCVLRLGPRLSSNLGDRARELVSGTELLGVRDGEGLRFAVPAFEVAAFLRLAAD
jgi:hypothetical protein